MPIIDKHPRSQPNLILNRAEYVRLQYYPSLYLVQQAIKMYLFQMGAGCSFTNTHRSWHCSTDTAVPFHGKSGPKNLMSLKSKGDFEHTVTENGQNLPQCLKKRSANL